jgi:hypothetical protein
MGLYLVVAHQTAASHELLATLQGIAARDRDGEFVLLVPATPVSHLLTWREGESEEVARASATEAARALRQAGLNLTDTVIGPPDPIRAIEEEHSSRCRSYSATIISTLPVGVSRWLRRDFPNRARNRLGIDVIHVVAKKPARAQTAA